MLLLRKEMIIQAIIDLRFLYFFYRFELLLNEMMLVPFKILSVKREFSEE